MSKIHADVSGERDDDASFEHAWARLAEIAETGVWDWMADKRSYRGGHPLSDRHKCPVAHDSEPGHPS
ncbi:hypothetical protein GCM10009677_32100 [Sphaerisporangium rubeum]